MQYFRLKPSTIRDAGVGVFATAAIPKGTYLRELFDPGETIRRLTKAEFEALQSPAAVREPFAVWCEEDACHLPTDPNRMSIGWYMNHSDRPNLAHDEQYDYFTLRDIAAGEELFIDYEAL
ncbi:MAG TPA: SET domain-containing protein [Gemmataceae bacterium]|jgi:SET domain-containing protein|nr:SET domain-containing protein [Gemmataceae bacterium]